VLITLIAQTTGEVAAPIAQGGAPDIPWLRMVLALALCLGLAMAAIGFARLRLGMPFLPEKMSPVTGAKVTAGYTPAQLAIVERLNSGTSGQFVILSRGAQQYLLHISQQGHVTKLDDFETENEGAAQ